MTFVVDADILGIFQRAEHLAPIQALGPLPWVITEEVWYEVTDRVARSALIEVCQRFSGTRRGGRSGGSPRSPGPLVDEHAVGRPTSCWRLGLVSTREELRPRGHQLPDRCMY
jgi:hypothetical protein